MLRSYTVWSDHVQKIITKKYIKYLQTISKLGELEELELEDLQGVSGLKAMRVAVIYDKNFCEKSSLTIDKLVGNLN